VLAGAACAALSADAPPGHGPRRRAAVGPEESADDAGTAPAPAPGAGGGPPAAGTGRVTVELLDSDGLVTGRGEATIRLAPT
jgi:hypothetical protein